MLVCLVEIYRDVAECSGKVNESLILLISSESSPWVLPAVILHLVTVIVEIPLGVSFLIKLIFYKTTHIIAAKKLPVRVKHYGSSRYNAALAAILPIPRPSR